MFLKKLIYNCRHYRLSIICLVQSYNAMPLAVRKTISILAYYSFLFACADTNELYKKNDRVLIKDHHAPEENHEGDEAEEG